MKREPCPVCERRHLTQAKYDECIEHVEQIARWRAMAAAGFAHMVPSVGKKYIYGVRTAAPVRDATHWRD